MKRMLLKLIALCLLAVLTVDFIPAASAQGEADQNPLFLIKIPDIEKLLSNVEKLVPPNATQQIASTRMMLHGTDWIDTERSMVAGMVSENAQTYWIVLVPFRMVNNSFQRTYGAVEGTDYYLAAFPPRPGFTVSSAFENTLVTASRTPATGSLILEAGAGRLFSMAEPMIAASLKKMQEAPSAKAPPAGLSPQDIQTMIGEMLNLMKQAEILRLGLDLDNDIFTILMDIEAVPDTALAAVLIDPGDPPRLMDYPIDMPIQFRSRAHNVSGSMDLLKNVYGSIYRKMGIDIDEAAKMTESFTGESVGGIGITSDGLAIEGINVLQPGIDGEAFIRDSYMPLLERYADTISDLNPMEEDNPVALKIERTADSSVAGVKAIGMTIHLDTPDPSNGPKINSIAIDMRMAAVNDLLYFATDDTRLEMLINGTRNLAPAPATGPMGRVDIDLAAYLKGIQSLMPSKGTPVVFPDELGTITTQMEMQNGKLKTRTSLNIKEAGKLISALGTMAANQKQVPAGVNNTTAP